MTDQPPLGKAEILRTRDYIGWDVVDRGGEKVGSVADLLIDRSGVIRHVQMEHGLPRRHYLLPQHQLEWGGESFVLQRLTREEARRLPPLDSDARLTAPLLEELTRSFPWFYSSDPVVTDPAETGEARVVPLSEAKSFRLESGAANPRGWNVFGSDGERVGVVTQLLVDPAALKVRYLDVDLLDDLFLLRDDRHVLVPLDRVDLKDRGNDVWVRGLAAADIARLPAYIGGAVDPWLERAVSEAFASGGGTALTGDRGTSIG